MNRGSKQVISIAPDGAISSLCRKTGLDLRDFGSVEIERVSDIKWDKDFQLWYINIINGPKKGLIVTSEDWLGEIPQNCVFDDTSRVLYFKEYEDAVAAEILFLDNLRKRGIF